MRTLIHILSTATGKVSSGRSYKCMMGKKREKKRIDPIRDIEPVEEEVPSTSHAEESKTNTNNNNDNKKSVVHHSNLYRCAKNICIPHSHSHRYSCRSHAEPCCQRSSQNIPQTALSPETRFSQIHFHTRLRKYDLRLPGREKLRLK